MTGERGAPPDGRPGTLARPGHNSPEHDPDITWVVFGYCGAMVLWATAPLAVYLMKRTESGEVRWHAAQSLNLVMTATLFAVCCCIVGGLLYLDTPTTGLTVLVTLLCALWLAMSAYLARAATGAWHGERYEVPGWLCVPMIS